MEEYLGSWFWCPAEQRGKEKKSYRFLLFEVVSKYNISLVEMSNLLQRIERFEYCSDDESGDEQAEKSEEKEEGTPGTDTMSSKKPAANPRLQQHTTSILSRGGGAQRCGAPREHAFDAAITEGSKNTQRRKK